MPALRPTTVFGDIPSSRRHNPHLTTPKEVRTYAINRPHLHSVKESTINGSPSASIRSSSSSAPDEYRHDRHASLDSSVSWQSNSTQSSGYSSVGLSSSTSTLDENKSPQNPARDTDYRERSSTDFGISASTSRQANKPSVSGSHGEEPPCEKPTRSLSVSELVSSFSGNEKPQVSQKLSYTHLPARPTQPPLVPVKPKSALQQGPRSQFAKSQVTFASMEDVRETNNNRSYTRRASTAETPSMPKYFPGENGNVNYGSYNVGAMKSQIGDRELEDSRSFPKKPAVPSKPIPVYRTAVYGVNLKGQKMDVRKDSISESEESNSREPTERYIPKYRKSLEKAELLPERCVINCQAEVEQAEIFVVKNDPVTVDNGSPTNEMELNYAKEELKGTITSRIALLKEEQDSVQEEIDTNESHGKTLLQLLSQKLSKGDLEKYHQHLREMEEITSLTMSLASRLHRLDRMQSQLKSPADDLEASTIQAKKKKLLAQQDEALYLEQGIERRRKQLQSILAEKYLISDEEYESYEQFFSTKMSLFRDRRELEDKIKLGEEQLVGLHNSSISLSS